MLKFLHQLKAENIISELNYQFAKLIDQQQQQYHYSPQQQSLAVLLSALVSFNVMQGNTCVRLDSSLALNPFGLPEKSDLLTQLLQKIGHISPLEWQTVLHNHIAFSQAPNNVAPLLFQHNRLYFYRYWQSENRIACYLQQAVNLQDYVENSEQYRQILDHFFEPQQHIDYQKIAVATALVKPFCLISGGPGTGKTRTVAILLSALQMKQQQQQMSALKIALIAPTGKAAARLKESISTSIQSLHLPDEITQNIPTQASTIHSLIGIRPNQDLPTYHAKNPLNYDLVVVDEASMIDLFIMEKLLNALKPTTRLVMLGDKDQLASVEAGNVMGELGLLPYEQYSQLHSRYLKETTGYDFPTISQHSTIQDALCHLKHSYRFNQHSGIGKLAEAINTKQAVRSWQLFAEQQYSDLELISYPPLSHFQEKQLWIQHCVNSVVEQAVEHYRIYLQLVKLRCQNCEKASINEIFQAFQHVRFLSALRITELGVEQLNQRIAEALLKARLVQFKHSRESYFGKPLLITENAPQQHIFSGDIGIILPDEQGRMRIYFETHIDGKHYNISPSRVPNYEPAYVMTVHKSQGSEFEHTFLIMPLSTSPVLTKELIYTAVTRARKRFTLFGEEKLWKKTVNSEVQRQSGLIAQLLQFSETE